MVRDEGRTSEHALLFFRMGDFYELFFADAEAAAAALDIALTARGEHGGSPIPMCGVPAHAKEAYLARLIRRGFRVALAEQTEDPRRRTGKGPLKREVVRLITPGTLTEDALLEAARGPTCFSLLCRWRPPSRPRAAIHRLSARRGSTSRPASFETAAILPAALPALLARLDPAEILGGDGVDLGLLVGAARRRPGGGAKTRGRACARGQHVRRRQPWTPSAASRMRKPPPPPLPSIMSAAPRPVVSRIFLARDRKADATRWPWMRPPVPAWRFCAPRQGGDAAHTLLGAIRRTVTPGGGPIVGGLAAGASDRAGRNLPSPGRLGIFSPLMPPWPKGCGRGCARRRISPGPWRASCWGSASREISPRCGTGCAPPAISRRCCKARCRRCFPASPRISPACPSLPRCCNRLSPTRCRRGLEDGRAIRPGFRSGTRRRAQAAGRAAPDPWPGPARLCAALRCRQPQDPPPCPDGLRDRGAGGPRWRGCAPMPTSCCARAWRMAPASPASN